MAKKKSFIMYIDHYRLINKLTNEECGMLLKAIYEYQVNGSAMELPPAADMLFGVICNQLDRDNEKWERTCARRAEAGRAGGRAKAESSKQMLANASKSKQTLANLADNDNDSDNDNDNVSDSESDSDNESAVPGAEEAPPAPTPTQNPPEIRRFLWGAYANVKLSPEELDQLKAERPNDWESKIKRLDEYLEDHPEAKTKVRYADHLAVLMEWAKQDDQRIGAAPAPRQATRPEDTSNHHELERHNAPTMQELYGHLDEEWNRMFGDKEE